MGNIGSFRRHVDITSGSRRHQAVNAGSARAVRGHRRLFASSGVVNAEANTIENICCSRLADGPELPPKW